MSEHPTPPWADELKARQDREAAAVAALNARAAASEQIMRLCEEVIRLRVENARLRAAIAGFANA